MWRPTGLIPWFSKTEGNTYATLLHHPFLFKGKPTQCSRGSKPLVKDGSPPLTTMMRRFHQWYMKTCSESGKDALTMIIKEEHDVIGTGLFSV